MIVNTITGEILDKAPRPARTKYRTYKRKRASRDEASMFIGLLGILVAAITLTV